LTLQQIMRELLSKDALATPNEMDAARAPDPRVDETHL
jgi:hypothetical protein